MAPAITHFLVGASLFLGAAVVIGRFRPGIYEYGLELVLAGGIWGLVPDGHRVLARATDPNGAPWGLFYASGYTQTDASDRISPLVIDALTALQSALEALHASRYADLFAFHYTLDRPFVRELYLESVFFSILLFTLSVLLFTYARGTNTKRDSST